MALNILYLQKLNNRISESKMKKFNYLTKAQMKTILGGNGVPEDESETGGCVYCTSSAGSSCWYRKNPLTTVCIEVYPHAFITEARVAACTPGCTMN